MHFKKYRLIYLHFTSILLNPAYDICTCTCKMYLLIILILYSVIHVYEHVEFPFAVKCRLFRISTTFKVLIILIWMQRATCKYLFCSSIKRYMDKKKNLLQLYQGWLCHHLLEVGGQEYHGKQHYWSMYRWT